MSKTTKRQLQQNLDLSLVPEDFATMIRKHKPTSSCVISGVAGLDDEGNPIPFELGDEHPHALVFGKTGTGKSILLLNILFSIMSATDPQHLRIALIDGKGNSFEFMKLDYDNPYVHPNPFTYAPPVDGTGDVKYARALIKQMVLETRHRVELLKEAQVAELAEYNVKYPDKALPEILLVVDELSTLTQQGYDSDRSAIATKRTINDFKYIIAMGRDVGIRMLLANQTARNDIVPREVSANIIGRLSLGVCEPVESALALPGAGLDLTALKPLEFFTNTNDNAHPKHGMVPYVPLETMGQLDDSLTDKFGQAQYVMTREQVIDAATKDERDGK